MKNTKLRFNESGIAHLGLIVLVVVVLAAGIFAFSRVKNAEDNTSKTETSQSANEETDAELGDGQTDETLKPELEDGQDATL